MEQEGNLSREAHNLLSGGKEIIDKDSFVPVYYQLAQILERKIKAGVFQPGDTLPSETELGATYGISRMTVRKALEKLAEAGLIYAERGKGTFVAVPRLERATFQIDEFAKDMQQRGLVGTAKLLEARVLKAPSRTARNLGVEEGANVLFLRRLLLANDEPLVYDRKYLRYTRGKPILEAELNLPLAELVSRNSDVQAVSSRLSIEATTVQEDEAQILKVPAGTPAFCVDQVLYSFDGVPLSWGWYIYRGDKYKFTSLARPL